MGIVYLIGDSDRPGNYKIGVTRGKLDNRLKKLQTGNSGKLYVKASYSTEYPFDLEKMLHNRYEENLLLNEWYYLDEDVANRFVDECTLLQSVLDAMEDNYYFKKKHKKL